MSKRQTTQPTQPTDPALEPTEAQTDPNAMPWEGIAAAEEYPTGAPDEWGRGHGPDAADAFVEAISERVMSSLTEKVFLRTAAEAKRDESWANDLEAMQSMRSRTDPPGPARFKIPVLHPDSYALMGYVWRGPNGEAMPAPEGEA